jgi:CDGSH-type Zn-finger protein/uncharacterized Fe-S cluster protein YjdI
VAAPAPAAAESPAPAVEVVKGRALTVLFEGRRCIHSRHCVLDAPGVFKANTPGAWIFPDAVSPEALMEVAHKCPSGAIRYEREDGGAAEAPPAVNTLFVRENGPYAVRAALDVDGDVSRYRATLCRCGQSKNKPYCDGSHVGAAFRASGEPETTAPDPLPTREGALVFTPVRNGPPRVEGNVEVCAGTGRTIARVTRARRCRCGHSQTKALLRPLARRRRLRGRRRVARARRHRPSAEAPRDAPASGVSTVARRRAVHAARSRTAHVRDGQQGCGVPRGRAFRRRGLVAHPGARGGR